MYRNHGKTGPSSNHLAKTNEVLDGLRCVTQRQNLITLQQARKDKTARRDFDHSRLYDLFSRPAEASSARDCLKGLPNQGLCFVPWSGGVSVTGTV